MPEIFYQASKSFKNIWIPDRGIQGQAKNGLKIAGVTRRWESKGFETRGPLIEPFRGDDTEAFSSGLFFVNFLCLFVFSSFPGVMRGLAPSLSVPSCLKFRRESSPSVIPEIFNRESKFLLFLFVFMFSSFQGGYKGGGAPFIVISPSPFEREKNM